MLGRIMSLLMFSFVGLAPVADTFFGALIEWNLEMVYLISGVLLTAVITIVLLQPAIQGTGIPVQSAGD